MISMCTLKVCVVHIVLGMLLSFRTGDKDYTLLQLLVICASVLLVDDCVLQSVADKFDCLKSFFRKYTNVIVDKMCLFLIFFSLRV